MDIKLDLKALVDKDKNEVIFAEANQEFVDLLFSFFSKPVGTIISLISKEHEVGEIVCMKNLLESVKNLDDLYFCTEACKTMLLSPQSVPSRLKHKLKNERPLCYFLCPACCLHNYYYSNNHWLVSYYNTLCPCGNVMDRSKMFNSKVEGPTQEGLLVGGLSHLIVTDELKLVSPSTKASMSLVPENRLVDDGLIEQTLTLGSNEVSKLLKCLLTSRHSLTETFLKPNPEAQLGNKHPSAGSLTSSTEVNEENTSPKISIKLLLSNSKKMVCYAEAQEDFVNLLFSFLTLPLGYVAKKMNGSCFKIGCVDHLYNSFMQLDTEKHLKFPEHKLLLVNPKLAPGYGYENQLLDIEQVDRYGCNFKDGLLHILTDDFKDKYDVILKVMDPKSDGRSLTKSSGFVRPGKFVISDNLSVAPFSSVSAISNLRKLKLSFGDVEERVVHIGKDEAVHLLLASFSSDSVLSNAFMTPEKGQKSSGIFRYE